MGAKRGQSRKSVGRQRLALIVFGALFVVLFAASRSPRASGSQRPLRRRRGGRGRSRGHGTVSEADLKRALLQQAAQAKLKKTPKPGEEKYEELKDAALGELLDTIWIQGEAEELGLGDAETDRHRIGPDQKTELQNRAEIREIPRNLRNLTQEDILDRVKLQLLSTQIQETDQQRSAAADQR